MATETSQASGGGIGCLTALGLIFITLKLTGNIDWSWWWVLSPFWGSVVFVALLLTGAIAISVKFSEK